MRRKYVILLLAVLLVTSMVTSVGDVTKAQGDCRTFAETGQSSCGKLLDYWTRHGGLTQQGFPLSGAFEEISETDGKSYVVQYFERAIFELHPEIAAPNDVLLSLAGVFLYQQKYPGGAPGQEPNSTAGSVAFPETGKRIGGIFLEYWKSHGALAQQGLPISDEFVEVSDLDGKQYRVQYFERAVFEYHPEEQAAYQVLLSQLGTFRYRAKYGASGPPPTVTVPGGGTTPPPSGGGNPPSGDNPVLNCSSAAGVYCAAAAVSNVAPPLGGSVRVTGRLMQGGQPVAGAVMNTTWHYKSKNTPCSGAKTGGDGYAGCTNSIGQPTAGYTVKIDVKFVVNGVEVASTETEFTPRR
ncbi:MAG: hypothetical protein ABIQ44_01805 [Chloroflexia bacterium]